MREPGLPANLAPNAFTGTARDYVRYRPPYPAALLDDVLGRLDARERLLDLATGPGRIAIACAGRFEAVLAVDTEPEMLTVGQELANARGVTNIEWRCARAEDLDTPPAAFDLITIGEAFHRLEQHRVLANAARWLKRGGWIAIAGASTLTDESVPWIRAMSDVRREWARDAFPDGWPMALPGSVSGPESERTLLRECGFEAVESRTYPVPAAWTIDEVAGYCRSLSICSPAVLGSALAGFELALRTTLKQINPRDTFEHVIEFGVTTGRRPN